MAFERTAPAGDFDYERGGTGYAGQRRADPRIAAELHAALGSGPTVINVGAGAGSYEPADREVTAVEPSAAMRAQRPATLPAAIDATAEDLPFADDSFDAAMATVTIHHWKDLDTGLRELRRVSRGPVVILTFDPDALGCWWLTDYAPEFFAAEAKRYPPIDHVRAVLGGTTTVATVPIPIDCTDGVVDAYYGRPEELLRPEVRRSQSGWGFVEPTAVDRFVAALASDLESGRWDERYGYLRSQPQLATSLRLIKGT